MTEQVVIYALVDPRTGLVRYVGKTRGTLPKRLCAHLRDKQRSHKTSWLSQLKAIGLVPDIFELELVPITQWQEAERFWISNLRALGCPLTNLKFGGDGASGATATSFVKGQVAWNRGKCWGEQTRAKISTAQKGKPKGPQSKDHRANHKAAMRDKNKGVPWSLARRNALKNENRTWSVERKAHFSEKMKAHYDSGWSPSKGKIS